MAFCPQNSREKYNFSLERNPSWIGLRDAHDNDTYVWLNGKILADSDLLRISG